MDETLAMAALQHLASYFDMMVSLTRGETEAVQLGAMTPGEVQAFRWGCANTLAALLPAGMSEDDWNRHVVATMKQRIPEIAMYMVEQPEVDA